MTNEHLVLLVYTQLIFRKFHHGKQRGQKSFFEINFGADDM